MDHHLLKDGDDELVARLGVGLEELNARDADDGPAALNAVHEKADEDRVSSLQQIKRNAGKLQMHNPSRAVGRDGSMTGSWKRQRARDCVIWRKKYHLIKGRDILK